MFFGAGAWYGSGTPYGIGVSFEPTALAPFFIRVGGITVKSPPRSLDVSLALGERSTMKCTVYDPRLDLVIRKGTPVEVYDRRGGLVFGGVATRSKASVPTLAMRIIKVDAVDWLFLAEKRIINAVYENMTAGAIARDLLTVNLVPEGVLPEPSSVIEDGPLMGRVVFRYKRVKEALDVLAERANFWWNIYAERDFHFRARESFFAPWDITPADIEWDASGSADLDEFSPDYRNRQMVQGIDITVLQTQDFNGDGKTQSWAVGYEIAKVPTVEVNAVAKTVGIRGVETGKDFYWQKGSPVISQEETAAPPLIDDTVTVEYEGMYPIVAISSDPVAIEAARLAEGLGTGIVDHFADDAGLEGRDQALTEAAAKLEVYAKLGRRFHYVTRRAGLVPGHLQKATLAEVGLDQREMLIERIRVHATETALLYDVDEIEGPQSVTFARLFRRVARDSRKRIDSLNIDEDETIVTLATEAETWGWTGDVTITENACHIPSDTLVLDENTVLC